MAFNSQVRSRALGASQGLQGRWDAGEVMTFGSKLRFKVSGKPSPGGATWQRELYPLPRSAPHSLPLDTSAFQGRKDW